jgi:hypothetical protein
MLGVNIYQQLSQISAVSEGCRCPVDVSPGAALCGDRAPENALAGRLQITLGKPDLGAGVAGDIKSSGDIGARCAGSNCPRVSAISYAEPQRVQHDRFPGTRLSGDASHAIAEIDLKVVNDRVILNREIE